MQQKAWNEVLSRIDLLSIASELTLYYILSNAVFCLRDLCFLDGLVETVGI